MLRNIWILLAFLSAPAFADPGLDAIRTLGRLNGEALACGQMALVDRIRITVVHGAPKTREVGETFEAATSERFLALGKDKSACPDGRKLSDLIESAIQAMHKAFAEQLK